MILVDELYRLPATTIRGETTNLSAYEGSVILVVNTASKCGFTNQYEGLETLYRKYGDSGFVVLGFPCNQFMHQEPGDEMTIQRFCELNFGVTFPLFAKIDVNGDSTHPLYRELKRRAPGVLGTGSVKWNFTKFLVGHRASVVKRFSPSTPPAALESEIESLLEEA